ncbi:MAG: GNAT family N-acetyltransferase, partial [Betaproteobacteria bacterium]
MAAQHPLAFSLHDDVPREEARLIDEGLGASNDAAAPLHEVRPLSCFARLPTGVAVGGAVGRTWGACCELQQLWVAPEHRRMGIGAALVTEFERGADARGCRTFEHCGVRAFGAGTETPIGRMFGVNV